MHTPCSLLHRTTDHPLRGNKIIIFNIIIDNYTYHAANKSTHHLVLPHSLLTLPTSAHTGVPEGLASADY